MSIIVQTARRNPPLEPDELRSFSFTTVCDAKEAVGADYRLWVDAFFLESRSIEMSFQELPDDEVGIDLYIPALKLERSKEVPVYQNVRLETGRGGLWITPTFVVALYAQDAIPGYTFLRLSERTGAWIKVKGEPGFVAGRLLIRLQGEAPKAVPAKANRSSCNVASGKTRLSGGKTPLSPADAAAGKINIPVAPL